MSHKLFRHSILCNARVPGFLKRVDAAESAACQAAGLRNDVRRFSLCCSVCRRRDRLAAEIDAVIGKDFAGRVLPFDIAADACRCRDRRIPPLLGLPAPGGRLPDRRHRPGEGYRRFSSIRRPGLFRDP